LRLILRSARTMRNRERPTQTTYPEEERRNPSQRSARLSA
jgi:hypothetical protein